MEKTTIQMVRQDLKSKRDALLLAHEQLKKDSDDWNKLVIILSLLTGLFESCKIKMGWDSDAVALVPIVLSSIIASVSALIKFKKFPEQQEVILQAQSLLTHTLSNARNQDDLSQSLLKEYHESLEKLETSIYPDIRKKFLKQSHNNLIAIMKQESKFYNLINKVNNGENVETDDSLSSNSNERNPISIDSPMEETI
jgi:bifunctional ADP-heptose synthase (sugar kinase/adenylyltransferase)